MELLGRLCSPYLLSLIGYCSESNRKLLVYEFMANGGLQEHLYPNNGNFILFELDETFRNTLLIGKFELCNCLLGGMHI